MRECAATAEGRSAVACGSRLQLPLFIKASMLCRSSANVSYYRFSLPTCVQFQVYNAILRRWPAAEFARYGSGPDANMFATTVHVLASAVQKLSRSVHIPNGTLLYRGLGGTLDLPEQFVRSDALGRRGYAEWGFMSTTTSREVAMQYSGVREGKPRATVLVIRTGAVDRGACIQVSASLAPCLVFSFKSSDMIYAAS